MSMVSDAAITVERVQRVDLDHPSARYPDVFQLKVDPIGAQFTSKAKAEKARREIQRVLSR